MLASLFRMALVDRFLGSGLGLFWAVLSPLMLLGIFCFVFTFVFPNRVIGKEGTLPFVIWLIQRLWSLACAERGAERCDVVPIVSAAGIVKNIAFKSELLPIVGALLGVVPLLVFFWRPGRVAAVRGRDAEFCAFDYTRGSNTGSRLCIGGWPFPGCP